MNLRFENPFEARTRGEQVLQTPPDTAELASVDTPTRAQPNATITADVEVSNTRCLRANVSHPDHCVFGASSGWRIEASAALEDSSDFDSRCHGCASRETYSMELTAPAEAGDYSLEIEVYGKNSGEMIGRDSTTITVESDAPDEPDPREDDGDDEPDLGIPGGVTGGLAILVVILVLLLAVGLKF